jgi:hypothetical protein
LGTFIFGGLNDFIFGALNAFGALYFFTATSPSQSVCNHDICCADVKSCRRCIDAIMVALALGTHYQILTVASSIIDDLSAPNSVAASVHRSIAAPKTRWVSAQLPRDEPYDRLGFAYST